jgi:2',3'-cyclic-nucleotide 2'-phosphodiesterase (5'-nucleotidase family)
MPLINIFFILVLVSSCASKPLSFNERALGHEDLYSLSKFDQYDDDKTEYKLDIIFIKNITNIEEKEILFTDRSEKIKVSGKDKLQSYLKIARKEFKRDLLLLNGGNHLDSSGKNNKNSVRFLNKIKPHANAITFDDLKNRPISYISLKSKHLKSPTIISNIIKLDAMDNFEVKKSSYFKIIEHKGVKVGIINIISPNLIPEESIKNLRGLIIEDIEESFLKYSMRARNNGAQIVIAFLNMNSDCSQTLSNKNQLPLEKVNFNPDINICDDKHNLTQIISKLPKNSIDVILLNSKNEEKLNNYFEDTLVLSHFNDGSYFSMAEIIFDKSNFKIKKKDSRVFGPIRTCHQLIKETGDCYTNDSINKEITLIPASFLGKELPTK